MLTLAALNTPSSNGMYYLRASRSGPLLTQVSWELTSSLTPSITLPYTILSSNSGYGSGDTCAFKIIQQTNRTTSTGAGFTVAHADNVSLYLSQFGYNSSGRFPTISPNYIQFQSPYAYIYSQDDIFLFCKSTTNNNISVRIQCMSNPDKVYISSNTNLNNWNLENVKQLNITDIYPNTTNNAAVRVFSNLECNSIFKCDTLQGYSAANLIKFNNDVDHNNLNVAKVNNIFCSIINANSTINSEIKFNNTTNFQNNLLTNYNLNFGRMPSKTVSGSIYQGITTNSTSATWGIQDTTTSKFFEMGLFKNSTGVLTAYHITGCVYSFQTNLTELYYINYLGNTLRHDIFFTNANLQIINNGTVYTRYLRNDITAGVDNFINCYNIKMQTNLDMNNFTITNYSPFKTNQIIFGTSQLNGFIKISNTTQSGVIAYGCSSNASMFENMNGESASITCDGNDNVTIMTAGDGGSHCNFQDEDGSNTRVSYINTGGALVLVSSKNRKHSIKPKNNNNVLERFLKLNVKSYGYKYNFNEDDSNKKKIRMISKSKRQNIGLILQEVYEIFPNVCSFYNNSLDDDLIDDENIKNKDVSYINKIKIEDVKDIDNMGIDYNTLLMYFIMAFQDYVKSNKNTNNNTIDNDLIIKNNLYVNDKLDEIKVRLDNVEYNNLRPNEVYRIKNIINTQDEVYKCINDDIKKVRLDNDILRDKHIEYVESNILINNNLKEKITNLENKINTYEEDIKFLKEENIKFKAALKLLLEKKKV